MRTATAVLGIAIVAVGAGRLRAQDLGQAAAKEKERRAKIGGSSKPLTEDDLKEAGRKRAKEAASPAPGGSGAAVKAKDPDTAADAGGSDDATAILAVAKKHVEEARRVRDDIEVEARREGIPPGYLR